MELLEKNLGKDTNADLIALEYGYQKVNFANPLKEAYRHMFGLTDGQLYGSLKETKDDYWDASPRTLLQFIGTNLFRKQFNQNVWVSRLESCFLIV